MTVSALYNDEITLSSGGGGGGGVAAPAAGGGAAAAADAPAEKKEEKKEESEEEEDEVSFQEYSCIFLTSIDLPKDFTQASLRLSVQEHLFIIDF